MVSYTVFICITGQLFFLLYWKIDRLFNKTWNNMHRPQWRSSGWRLHFWGPHKRKKFQDLGNHTWFSKNVLLLGTNKITSIHSAFLTITWPILPSKSRIFKNQNLYAAIKFLLFRAPLPICHWVDHHLITDHLNHWWRRNLRLNYLKYSRIMISASLSLKIFV